MIGKKHITIALLLTAGVTPFATAQQTFDAKKHTRTNVDASSLKAKSIVSPASKGARSSVNKAFMQGKQPVFNPTLQRGGIQVVHTDEAGLPAFIRSSRTSANGRTAPAGDLRQAAYVYLHELKDVLRIQAPAEAFSVQSVKTGRDNRTHVRLAQRFRGIPVYGADVVVHLDQGGRGEAFNGQYRLIPEALNVTPALSGDAAIGRVQAHLSRSASARPLTFLEKKLVLHEMPAATLCIYRDNGLVKTDVLAYHVTTCPSVRERWEYFVDANTGAVLHHYKNICTADGPRTATGSDLNGTSRTINTYQIGSQYALLDVSRPMYKPAQSNLPDEPVGGILTIDMNNTFGDDQSVSHVVTNDNVWNTANEVKALSAHFNAGLAYEYFRTKHGRESIDGAGGTIISIVNVPDEDGAALDNAFWNGKAMFYGNGDVALKVTAGGYDVAGHEMTHGVVQNTANLEYQGESGAINESMADIFGTMIDPDGDWLMGEDIVKVSAFPSGAMRSLSDPHNGGSSLSSPGYQPKHVNEQYTGTQDNGGVHINSGIPNHAFYRFATTTTRTKAADVFYKALDDYLTKSSRFIDLRLAVIQAATDLYGAGSAEVVAAGNAFDAVGITNGQGGDYEEELPTNPGTEFMLVYNTDVSDPNTLYRATTTSPASFEDLTTTDFLSRPSVTDRGDVAVFVASDNTIHAIKLLPNATAAETVLQSQQIWSNVVVSKGGTKMAAVTTDQDASIYVYDFGSGEWAQFQLYNPTYSDGVVSGGPVYADALEFDYTGEFLVYDCFNRIKNQSGNDIEYWDVNFIHVWDGDAGDFADGTIEKLFASLPDGVSVGNPSFAKNSPGIIAFDLVNEIDDYYAVLGCNIETNDLNVIAENNSLGWPSYNRADQRIAFTVWDDAADDYGINYVTLSADKISGSGAAQDLFSGAKWPVYFSTGERVIGDEVVTDVPDQLPVKETVVDCYPNAVDRELVVSINDPVLAGGRLQIVNTAGQAVFYRDASSSDNGIVLDLAHLKSGYYYLRVTGGSASGGCKIVKR